MNKLIGFFILLPVIIVMLCWAPSNAARIETGFYPLTPTGVHVLTGALAPNLRKWYLPQELYYQYGWKGWDSSNYARESYIRYTDITLEGRRWYDIYGDYITKGWEIYNWTEDQPARRGSQLRKSPEFSGWFDNVLISKASKGQFYTAVTIGDAVRTTLTPMTFSTPSFNGLQWDFLTDKYGFTALASRLTNPEVAAPSQVTPGTNVTSSSRFFGLRGTYQVGDFVSVGAQYVNAHNANNDFDFGESSYRGVLTEGQDGNVTDIVIRLSDDSPEDGVGGAVFYQSRIIIDGIEQPAIAPTIEGGRLIGGLRRADGSDVITLTYNVQRAYEDLNLGNYQNIKKIEFILVLANDYRVDITSNLQTNVTSGGGLGQPVFLTVARASGNVRDGSNQTFVRFMYGLPTGNDIYGATIDVSDFLGFDLRAEYDVNRRFRRFPNVTLPVSQEGSHPLAQSTAKAFYLTASQQTYPWFAYGEVFSMDPAYTTSAFVSDDRGFIDYENTEGYIFEFVDDNDDQDRFPDWNRRNSNQRAIMGGSGGLEGWDRQVFPGYDENNDLISDFNQNQNLQPDYDEPFLKYNVDPPEFLFGLDMNNNGTVDRFENDNFADYPYKKDHRGYNLYTGLEVMPGVKVSIGRLHEWLLGDDKRSIVNYGLFTFQRDYAKLGQLQLMYNPRRVKDTIADPLLQWQQPPGSAGVMQDVADPLVTQDTFVHTAYLQFDYTGVRDLNFTNKLKYEVYKQQGNQAKGSRDQRFIGIIDKADRLFQIHKDVSLWPKWKSMYRRVVPTKPGQIETKELSEVFFLIAKYALLERTWLELGTEYTIFENFINRPILPPPGFTDDFRGTVLAAQFSNTTDYLGYQLTGNLGFRWERRRFEDQTTIGTTFFTRIYAGAQR